MDAELNHHFFLPDRQATEQWGKQLGQCLPVGTVILLEGNLGAGKTSLVQGIGLGLGITEPIVSPTFNLINEYREGRCPLYHLDLYRLNSLEVEYLYVDQYWLGEDFPLGIVAIEWPDKLISLPPQYLKLSLTTVTEGRQVQVEYQQPDPKEGNPPCAIRQSYPEALVDFLNNSSS